MIGELFGHVAELQDELRPTVRVGGGGHRRLRGGFEQLELLAKRRHQGLVLLGLGDQRRSDVAHLLDRRASGVEARVGMIGVVATQRRIMAPALLGREHTARREATGQRWPAQIRRKAGNRVELLGLVLIELGDRGEQGLGVGVTDVLEQLHGLGGFDLASGVHDEHTVGPSRDHSHVVGNQDDPHPKLALDLVEQGQDLGLDRDVERRRGLVGDQQLWVAGEGHRDHHALAQTA